MVGVVQSGKLIGFTMIELVIVMSIVSTLLVIAVPYLTQFIMENRIKAAAGDLNATFMEARNYALRTGVPVIVCASSGQAVGGLAQCDGVAWTNGWLSFVDYQRNATPSSAGVVSMHGRLSSVLRISVQPAVSTKAFQFLPSGQVNLQASGSATAWGNYVAICDVSGARSSVALQILFLLNGRSQLTSLGECP